MAASEMLELIETVMMLGLVTGTGIGVGFFVVSLVVGLINENIAAKLRDCGALALGGVFLTLLACSSGAVLYLSFDVCRNIFLDYLHDFIKLLGSL